MILRRSTFLVAVGSICLAQAPTKLEQARNQIVSDIVSTAEQRARTNRTTPGAIPGFPFGDSVQAQSIVGFVSTYLAAHTVNGADLTVFQTSDRKQAYRILADLIDYRTDKQVGSTSESKGTTSVALKGIAPEILGFAAEHGALAKEVSGNTVTFRGTPIGLIKALQGRNLLDIYHDYENSAEMRFWRRLSFGLTFNADEQSRTNPQMGSAAAEKLQVASWSARAEIINHRDPKLRRYAAHWEGLARGLVPPYNNSRIALTKSLVAWKEFESWRQSLEKSVKPIDDEWQKNPDDLTQSLALFRKVLTAALVDLETIIKTAPSGVATDLDAYVRAIEPLLKGREEILQEVQTGMLLTADWTTARDAQAPDLYTLTGVFEFSPVKKNDLTLNFGWSWFRVKPQAKEKYRDFKLTGQYDRPLGEIGDYGPFVFSLAGRWEYIPEDTVTPGAAAVAAMVSDISAKLPAISGMPKAAEGGGLANTPKGHIRLFQAKLTIPLKGSGMKIPLSFTVANRTELINEKDVRVNFGFTFDFDSFLAHASKR